MFNLLVTQSLRNRLLVIAAASLLVVFGLLLLPRLNVDVLPDLNRPTVTVMTEAEGLAPQEVEQLVTFPIEAAMNGLPAVTRVRSVSGIGLSVVTVEFDWSSDIYRNRQQVSERLGAVAAQLPARVTPQMGPVTSIMGEILLIAVRSDTLSPMELREIADYSLRPQLLTVPGVAQVIPIGGEVRQLRVAPSLAALQALDIAPADVEKALRRLGQNTAGGFVEQRSQEFLIRNVGLTTRLEDVRNIVVATRQGTPVTLRQLASVDYVARVKRGDAGFGGSPAVIISVQKQPGADTLVLTRRLEDMLATLQASLPKGVDATRIQFRQATFIETSIGNLTRALLEASVVVAVLLLLFLLNWRATVISLTAIPVSVLVTVIVFAAFGLSINTMTLGGLAIAIGELVDDAVVDVENILRRLSENARLPAPEPRLAVIARASQEVRSGVLYATLIVILVLVPLFALSGMEGRLFTPLAVAYMVAIIASLVTSITLTPVMAYYLFPAATAKAHHDSWLVALLKAGCLRLLAAAFLRPRALIAAAVAAVATAAALGLTLPRTFLPSFNEGTATINLGFQPGISLRESNRLGAIAERLLLDVPEVRSVGRRTGRAELDEHAEGVHASEIDVDLVPSGRAREIVLNDIRLRLSALPATVNVGQPISHRLDHLLSGVRAEIAVKIFGDDLDTLRVLAEAVRSRMGRIPGVVDLQVEKQVPVPQVRVVIDYERAALYGLTAPAIAEALEGLSNGRVVSQIADGPRRIDVVMRLSDASRSTAGLGDILIATPSGMIPLRLVASIAEIEGPSQIQREAMRRRIVVMANTGPHADMGQIAGEIRRILAATPLPQGYTVALEGTFQAQEAAARMILALALVSMALIFLILYQRYASAVLALIVMGNIPLALVGSVAALWISGLPLSVASMIGFITLAGITARNGILKVSHTINLALGEGLAVGPPLIVRASLERLAPVLMTALSAGLALLPLLWGGSEPGREILHPVAVTIFGGLLSATALDLVLTPVLLLLVGRRPIERLRARAASPGVAGRPAEVF
ncbi:MAG: efflux RND transporter permease subunit [Hyphomicrobiaceae bacterium]|nr:efflux RND transporter permease subunit [Hyphomicrobiaceae bacterium]